MTSISTIYSILVIIISALLSHDLVSGTNISTESRFKDMTVLNSLKDTTTRAMEQNVPTTIASEIDEHVRIKPKEDVKIEWILIRVAALFAACLFICCVPWCQTNISRVIKEQKVRAQYGPEGLDRRIDV